MSRFGQVLTMREEGLLFTRVEEELLRILKRWAAQQDGELSPYQKGPQPWRGVLKMLSDSGSGRGVAQQFQRAHREYSRAGDEAGRQNLEYRLKEAWNQARGNYKYNIGRRTNAFGNLSGTAREHMRHAELSYGLVERGMKDFKKAAGKDKRHIAAKTLWFTGEADGHLQTIYRTDPRAQQMQERLWEFRGELIDYLSR